MKRCLVVDDSPTVRKILCRIVSSMPFEVQEAGDGREALERCREAMPDVILLDWNMPVMDGLEFLQKLRQLDQGDRPIVIFCTTVNEVEQISRALEAGADEYIMKPFDEQLLRIKFEQTGVLS